ncbi:MAG: tRNA (guanosine(18)-2'-O)-methyltransferase TrmH [Gemmatimonadetes bacterium]|nr:tRNA (guanosine(18)-2'-O)-methyltransferase TrmH [Gemmatimonadota bacterium]
MNPERFRRIRETLARRQPDLTVLMESVNKTHNFSAILRSCDAVGVLEAHGVMPEKGIDLHHHTSAGTTRWMGVRVHEDVRSAIGHLHGEGFTVVAAHPSDRTRDFRGIDLTRPIAFMVGAELFGLSEEGISLADETVMIPMAGMVRSLNVSVATALLLFEAFRQRDAKGMYEEARIPAGEFKRLLFEWSYPEIAQVLRKKGQPFPALSDQGEILP